MTTQQADPTSDSTDSTVTLEQVPEQYAVLAAEQGMSAEQWTATPAAVRSIMLNMWAEQADARAIKAASTQPFDLRMNETGALYVRFMNGVGGGVNLSAAQWDRLMANAPLVTKWFADNIADAQRKNAARRITNAIKRVEKEYGVAAIAEYVVGRS